MSDLSPAPIDVAITGIGCRLPGGARSPEEFWDFLLAKGDGMVDVPADRWNVERFYDEDPDAPGRMYVKRGGFLTQQSLWDFDPEYFGISPREASIMDPQQRLVLEVAVEALDDAGSGPVVSGRDVGVYVGGFMGDNLVVRHSAESRSAINSHTATSGTFTMLSNRLSYVLDLHGPSMTIDTACSSSLVAIHEASQAVARGECEVAIAGGVNAMIRPETFVAMCKGRFLAPDGRCKTFDASADGYARGEGAGMLVLKPLARAEADGDRVYAVIRATGANQDGRTSGITVPNPVSQAALARRVLAQSGLEASDIGYVEAHGTGTSIGDPLEMEALGAVYGDVAGRERDLVVGSVKASIGHTEAAAGVAGVIKAALTAYHGQVAPQAWLEQLNPAIPFAEHRISVPLEAEDLPAGPAGRAIAVNGFGYGGTNAHVVLTDAPVSSATLSAPEWTSSAARDVLPLSARTEPALREQAASLRAVLARCDEDAVADVVAAAWGRRVHHPARATVAGSREEMLDALDAIAEGTVSVGKVVAQDDPRPVVVFSGMGPQWWRMGRDLLAADGVFARTAREIDEAFVPIAGWSIIEALCADEESSTVTRTEVAQPANFLVQVALLAELEALGVDPAAVVGHSVGEVSAAYTSGALSLHDALLVSYHRSRLQATTAGSGGMLAVGLPEAEARGWFDAEAGTVSIAAVNSPSAVTLAGDTAVLTELAERLSAEGVFARALRVEVPYHSHLMDPILAEIESVLGELRPSAPTRPLWSSVTGAQVEDAGWGAAYWVDNVREPVRFADTVDGLVEAGHRVFLEVGPHPVLGGNIREILVRGGESGTVVSTLNRDQDDVTSLRRVVAELYVAGALRTDRVPGSEGGAVRQVRLPAYSWQRTRMWAELDAMVDDRLGTDAPAMLATRTVASAPTWQVELSRAALPWLSDHVVDSLVVLPGAAYLDMALSAAVETTGRAAQSLADVRFSAARIIDEHDVPTLRLGTEPSTGRFTIDSRAGDDTVWSSHVHGRVVDGAFTAGEHDLTPPVDGVRIDGESLYEQLTARGLSYGPAFQGIIEAWAGAQRLVARVDARTVSGSRHLVHPATVDAALQCVAALVASGPTPPEGPVVPYAMTAVRRYEPLPDDVVVAVRRLDRDGLWADIALATTDGTVCLEMLGVEFRPVRPPAALTTTLEGWWYEESWERQGQPAAAPSTEQLAGRLVVVGDASTPAAAALVAAHPAAELVGADTVAGAVRRALETDPVLTTVAVVPSASAGPDADPAMLVLDTARALSGLLDEIGLAAVVEAADVMRDPDAAATLALDERSSAPALQGVVVSEQAFGLPGDVDVVQLGHAALVGLRRTLRNEQPPLAWRLVDAEASTPSAELAAEVLLADSSTDADEVALRGGVRLVTRFLRNLPDHLALRETPEPMTDPEGSFVVEAPGSMLMGDLCLREQLRRAPGAREIEVRVVSAGLNYKDAGKVIGLLTSREMEGTYFGTSLGMEVLADVVGVGEAVEKFSVGDRVSISARHTLARYVTIDLDGDGAVELAPTTWGDADSALNLPFFTAHHALADAARVAPGETVLVHGAAGGVGLAAIQVARRLGARVIGTAGSPERREAVLAAGAEAVLDSRSLDFVAEVLALTGGEGADVVLNSAPGEVVGANLEVAAEFGRVVEIGKSDIYGRGLLPLAPFDRNITFMAIDIDRLFAKRRPVVMALIDTVFALFEAGEYTPLPVTTYPVSELGQAFEAVIRGTHIGRVVLDFTEEAPPVRPVVPSPGIRDDAAYLITGGFGDFGLATARWMVDQGARHLVLAGRSGASTIAAKEQVAELVASGVEVEEVALDVASFADVSGLLARLGSAPVPLRGVVHAAGVLDDRPFADVDRASIERVMAPKALGAWNLHRASVEHDVDLDLFVTYSSASSITGNEAQASYAAANTVLDSLVHLRRQSGLSGLSVNWGALSGGMAGSSNDVEKYLAAIGLRTMDMALSARTLGEALALDVTQVGIIDIDWARWGATHPMSAGTPRFAEHVAQAATAGSEAAVLAAELAQLPETQQSEVVAYMLAEQLAVVLGVPADTIDVETPLPDLGMDSLMAVELQARVNLSLGIEVSALELTRGGGLSGLAARLLPDLLGTAAAVG